MNTLVQERNNQSAGLEISYVKGHYLRCEGVIQAIGLISTGKYSIKLTLA